MPELAPIQVVVLVVNDDGWVDEVREWLDRY